MNGTSDPLHGGGPDDNERIETALSEAEWTEDQWRQVGMTIGRLDDDDPLTPDMVKALVVWVGSDGPT